MKLLRWGVDLAGETAEATVCRLCGVQGEDGVAGRALGEPVLRVAGVRGHRRWVEHCDYAGLHFDRVKMSWRLEAAVVR